MAQKPPSLRHFLKVPNFYRFAYFSSVALGMLALAGLCSETQAQMIAVDLQGTVVDTQGKGIAGATIKLLDNGLSAISDSQGSFALKGTYTNGIIRRTALPGGFRLGFSKGRLTLDNPTGRPVKMEWISMDGRVRTLPQGGTNDLDHLVHSDQATAAASGIHWLRVTTESGVSTFRYVKTEAENHGRLFGGSADGGTAASATASSSAGLQSAGSVSALKLAKSGALSATANLVLEVSASGFLDKRFPQGESVKSGLTLGILPVTSTLKERVRDFLGAGLSFRLAFLRKEAGDSRKFVLNYVDMAEMAADTMPVHVFPDSRGPDNSPYGAFGPSWSPDGRNIAYETGFENLTTPISRIYIQPLAGPRKDGPGIPSTNPRWWTDGKDTSLIWCTSGAQSGWADTGSSTKRQKVSGGNLSDTSQAEILAKGSYNAGLSTDGRYLATGYPFGVMLDRTANAKHYFHIYPGHPKAKDGSSTDSLQVCNASVSQDPAHPGRMLFLDFGVPEEPTYANLVTPKIYAQHRMILIGDYDSEAPGRIVDFIDTPPAELAKGKTWDDPEWTTSADFAVATTRDPNGDLSDPSGPVPTQPDIYLIKLSTKESLKVFAGGNQTLPVAWIGPAQ